MQLLGDIYQFHCKEVRESINKAKPEASTCLEGPPVTPQAKRGTAG